MHGAQPLALHAVDVAHHVHHRFIGPHVDYFGVGLAAAVSWVGLTGPGEAALIAAGISAAHGHVDIVAMIAVAWCGAMGGGVAGWLVGLKGGRALMIKPGPLYRLRMRLLRHGDSVYERRGWLAVYLAPSWMAGISAMPARRFVPANFLASLIWAAGIGLGSYVAGRSIADALGDIGVIGLVALIGVVAVPALIGQRRRRRH
jgi:membrane protein DedA with SNARE-associated domain